MTGLPIRTTKEGGGEPPKYTVIKIQGCVLCITFAQTKQKMGCKWVLKAVFCVPQDAQVLGGVTNNTGDMDRLNRNMPSHGLQTHQVLQVRNYSKHCVI